MKSVRNYISEAQWDSDHFAIKVGNAELEDVACDCTESLSDRLRELIAQGRREQYRLLYFRSRSEIPIPEWMSSEAEVLLADTKVVYSKELQAEQAAAQSECVSSYPDAQADAALLELSFESGKYSRFRLDANFPAGTFEKMYSIWIDRSVKREIADDVLVYRDRDSVAGMLTYAVDADCATIGLVAVDVRCQGQRIGSKLMCALETAVCSRGVTRIEVATQKLNLAACRFYEKTGFAIKETMNIYHIWL